MWRRGEHPAVSVTSSTALPDAPFVDPWSVASPARRPVPLALRLLAALLIGAAAPVARLAVDGFHGRAVVVALLAVGWLVLVEERPRRIAGLAMLAAVGVAAVLLAWSSIGRAPILVALAAVFVAHATLVRWQPLAGWPDRRVTVAGLAMFPLVGAGILWFREESLGLTGGLLVVALAVVEAYDRWPTAAERVDGGLLRTLVGVAGAIGAAVLFVVVLVVLYLPGAVGAAADRFRRSRPRSSYWSNRSTDHETLVRDVDRPFSSAPPGVRRNRNLMGGALMLVLAVAVTVLVTDRRSAEQEIAELDRSDVFERAASVRFSDLAAYEGDEWADALKSEQDVLSNEYLRPSDVSGYDVADFAGEFTNVVDGARRTIEPPPCPGCSTTIVWIAGGSSAFGLGQRDDHTVASALVGVAAEDDISAEVVNLGVPGFTIHQEAKKVLARLDAGAPPPDTVIFYNGYNDVVATVMDSTVNGVRPDEPTLMESGVIRDFTEGGLDPYTAGSPNELGRLAAAKYRREADQIAAELARRGVETVFVFQPDALASPDQYRAVSAIYELDENVRSHMDASLEVASTSLEDRAINLRHLLDDEPPVFADLVHTNEAAAVAVAAALISSVSSGAR
jgi:lysophospholipase L1-like esterase